MWAMPQSSRIMVTLAASRSQRLTSGFPFAWSSAEEGDKNRSKKTRFFRKRQIFMLFFSLRSRRHVFFLCRSRAVRTVYLAELFTGGPPYPPGYFGRKVPPYNDLQDTSA